MDPEELRLFLTDNGCRKKRERPDGTEVWTKEGLDMPIVFFNRGLLSARELERLLHLKGEEPGALGAWRKARGDK